MKEFYFSILKSFKDGVKIEPMVSLNNSFELLALVKRIGPRVILACSSSPVKITKRLKLLINFAKYLIIMTKHNGSTYTVKYLKSSLLALQKCVSKDRINSPRELEPDLPLPRYTTSGLPRFIPLADRRAIISGNSFIIKYWSSLFALYRVIKIPGTLKLKTITDPFSGDENLLKWGIERIKDLSSIHSFRFDNKILSKEFGLLPMETASPSNRVSWRGWFSDVHNLVNVKLDTPLKALLQGLGQSRLKLYFTFIQEFNFPIKNFDCKISEYPSLGQLATKEEAAGKIRVFALVDVWTQSALKPIHEFLFNFLKTLPNDGTFDQRKSVQRCIVKAEKAQKSFGYDLSAATDRLPINLQVAVLSILINPTVAENWKELLVGRSYILKDNDPIKYSVGQPMGALSSWAMLATTHHLIVQLAYQICRPIEKSKDPTSWYENYELLGDDVVIFDEDVALTYLSLMEGFGVAINQSKSVIAKNNSFEFAKVFAKGNQYLSPISWKMFISQNTMMGRVNITHALIPFREKKVIPYVKNIVWKNLGNLGNYSLSLIALATMLIKNNDIGLTYVDLLRTLIVPESNWTRRISSSVKEINISYMEKLITCLINGLEVPKLSNPKILEIERIDTPWHKITLFREIIRVKTLLISSENVKRVLTRQVQLSLIPDFPESLTVVDYTNFQGLSSKDLELSTFYTMIDSIIDITLGDISFIDGIDKMVLNSSVDELIGLLSRLQRVLERFELVHRANEKLEGTSKNRKVVDSPLKALEFIRKTNNKRPLWTKTTSF